MKPPRCAVCIENNSLKNNELNAKYTIKFKDYKKLPKGLIGHPTGLIYFCEKHYQLAKDLTHLNSNEIIKLLSQKETSK